MLPERSTQRGPGPVEVAREERPGGRAARGVTALLAVLATALPLLFHTQFVSGDRILYRSDNAQQLYLRLVVLCDALQHERAWPIWQELVYGGSPFHANPEVPTLYLPILVLAALADPIWTLNLTVLLHLAASALGMYLLVLRLGRRIGDSPSLAPAGAFVAATVFSLGFFLRGELLMNLVVYGAAHALIPWIFLAADGVLTGARPGRSAGLLALLIAGQVFTGGLYVFAYTWVALVLWFAFLGLAGGASARRRALRYGTLAAGLAFVIVLAKLLPYLEWMPATSRGEGLALEESLGVTLGGHGSFDWAVVGKRLLWSTGGGWALLPALFALPLLRHGTVRLAAGLVALSLAVALGGPAWRFLHDHVFPFSQIRGATRGWVLGNAFLPVLAGLGTCWLLGRSSRLRAAPRVAALVGVVAGLLLAPRLSYSYRHEATLRHPESFRELLARYPRWREVAARAGREHRAAWLERDRPGLSDERFITAALGIETVNGSLGYVWPLRHERHLYGPPAARVDRTTRRRRMATQSVRWLVVDDPAQAPSGDPQELSPMGIEGTALEENQLARPRACLPAAVAAIVDDAERDVLYGLLDSPRLPIDRVSLLSVDREGLLEAAQLPALSLLLVVDRGGAPAPWVRALQEDAARAGVPVRTVRPPFDEQARDALTSVAGELADAAVGTTRALAFERRGRQETVVGTDGEDGTDGADGRARPGGSGPGRFAVVSEPWSWYEGWTVTGAGRELSVLPADGIGSAVYLGPQLHGFRARYAPRSVSWGLAACALGTLAALALVLRRGPAVADARRGGAGLGAPS